MCPGCPNIDCEYFGKNDFVVKNGTKFRKDDSKKVQRYYCKFCGKYFSTATLSLWKGDHKRHCNLELLKLYNTNISLRQLSRKSNLSYSTVFNKIKKYGPKIKIQNQKIFYNPKRKTVRASKTAKQKFAHQSGFKFGMHQLISLFMKSKFAMSMIFFFILIIALPKLVLV